MFTAKILNSSPNSSEGTAEYFAKEDYYAKDDPEHQKASSWFGKGAERLGLVGNINPEDHKNILAGELPNGDILGKKDSNGKREHAPGIGGVFSAPKSVSIMAILGGDKRLMKAHENAVKASLTEMEKQYSIVRVRSGGYVEKQKQDNLTIATYRHDFSRNYDPQLHTHCIIANVVQKENGDWRSLDYDKILENQKDYLGTIYKGKLAFEAKKLGYEIEVTGKDCGFELKNVPEKLLKEFSSRSEEIKEWVKNYAGGEDSVQNRINAAINTRKDKAEGIDRNVILSALQSRVTELKCELKIPEKEKAGSQNYMSKAKEAVDHAIKILSERNSVFERNTLLKESQTKLIGQILPEHIEKRIDDLISRKGLLVSTKSELKEKDYLTTPELLALEKEAISLMREGRDKFKAIYNKFDNSHFKDTALNAGQRDAVKMILTTKDKMIGIQGHAGTGKSFMISEARKLAKAKDFSFIGMAPSGSALENLKIKSKISDCKSLQGFLEKYDGYANDRGTVEGKLKEAELYKDKIIILDEVGMVSTKQMRDFLKITEALNIRTVGIGDIKQLDAVEAGNPFHENIKAGMKVSYMDEIRRQDNIKQKEAVYASISGDIKKAFDKIGDNIIEFRAKGKNQEEVKGEDLVANKYLSFNKADRENSIVVAQTNKSTGIINNLIREGLVEEKQISGAKLKSFKYTNNNLEEEKKRYATYYQLGDMVLFNKKIDFLKINKSIYGEVIKIDKQKNLLTIKHNKKTIEFNPKLVIGKREGTLETFKKEAIEIQKGDIIRFNRGNKDEKILNAQMARVEGVSKHGVELGFINDNQVTEYRKLSIRSNALKHIDYGYCSTVHKSQGRDARYVIGLAESTQRKLSSQKNFYVEISRAKEESYLFVDNKERLIEQLYQNTGVRISALEHQKTEKQRAVIKDKNSKIQSNDNQKLKKEFYKIEVSEHDLKRGFEEHIVQTIGSISGLNLAVNEAFRNLDQKIRFGEKKSYEICWHGEAGYIKNYKSGEYISFGKGNMEKGSNIKRITETEAKKIKLEFEQQKKTQALKLKQKQEQISKKVTKWINSEKPLISSKYLDNKGLKGLKIEGLKYNAKYGILMPLKDIKGKIHSMQIIKDDGTKRMIKDGKKSGNFFIVGEDKLKNSKNIFIAEGLATAGTIYKNIGNPVMVAVDANNLKNVSKAIQDQYKNKKLTIVADNDFLKKSKNGYVIKDNNLKDIENLNKGISVAKDIKKNLGIDYIYPKFEGMSHSKNISDFNDLARIKGDQEVKKQILEQTKEISIDLNKSKQMEIEK